MSEKKKVVIIGAGIAGLATGAYLQMNGYATEIFEMGHLPGGVCTAWKRGSYTFDSCIHWLVGSSPLDDFHKIWQELGAIEGRTFIDFEELARYEGHGHKTLVIYTDVDRFEKELLSHAPEDRAAISDLAATIRLFTRLKMPIDKPAELTSFWENLSQLGRLLPYVPTLLRWRNMTMAEHSQRFQNQFLRDALANCFGDERFSAIVLPMALSWMHKKSAGYPIGGSLPFSRAIEKRYRELGGAVNYGCRVKSITVSSSGATGIVLEDGTEHAADIVVSAADGYTTIFRMLGGKYMNSAIEQAYRNKELFPPLVQISIGVSDPMHGVPHSFSMPLPRPFIVDNKTRASRIGVNVYNFDPTLAADGKTAITILVPSVYEFWENLRVNNPHRYAVEKERIAREVIGILDNRFPGFASRVETFDVATPATWVRYTGNWHASFEGWLPTPRMLRVKFPKTLPGLKNFYMVGQWVQPGGGLPPAALSGRHITQLICAKDNKQFVVNSSTAVPAV